MLALIAVLAAGGGGGSHPGEPARPAGNRGDSLLLEISVPARVQEGDPVPITLVVRNAGAEAVQLYLQGRPVAFDITVTRPDGAIVWRRLEGQAIPAILQTRTLSPGDSLEFKDQWDQRSNGGKPAGAGTYRVTGALLTDSPQPLKTEPKPLRIVPRGP